MFDAELILIKGTVNIDDTVGASFLAATDTTIVAGSGAVVADVSKTGANGLAAVMILPVAADAGDNDTLTAFIEASDEVDFASDIHKLGSFDIAGATGGVILGAEGPDVAVLRFATNKKYVRANLTPAAVDGNANFGKIKVYLSPYPFVHL